jgi:hypothetical protein
MQAFQFKCSARSCKIPLLPSRGTRLRHRSDCRTELGGFSCVPRGKLRVLVFLPCPVGTSDFVKSFPPPTCVCFRLQSAFRFGLDLAYSSILLVLLLHSNVLPCRYTSPLLLSPVSLFLSTHEICRAGKWVIL